MVVFRKQPLSPEAQVQLGRSLGALKQHTFINSLDGFPEIMVVRKEAEELHNFAGAWHTDTSYQETPAMGSMLLPIEVPDGLGDTLFCNMVAAFDALGDSMQAFLEGKSAVHSFSGRSMAGREQDPGCGALANNHQDTTKLLQPVIRTHFASNGKMIYLTPMFTESICGLSDDESETVLSFLYRHCIKPEFVRRLRWQPGAIAIWDNAATMHCPLNDYAGHRRVMHRVVIAGDDRCGRILGWIKTKSCAVQGRAGPALTPHRIGLNPVTGVEAGIRAPIATTTRVNPVSIDSRRATAGHLIRVQASWNQEAAGKPKISATRCERSR